MRAMRIRTLAAVLAAVITVTAFAGCASGDKDKDKTEKTSAADGAHSGEKKLDVYVDDNGNPYFYDKDNVKQMLFFADYNDQLAAEQDDDPKTGFIYGHYDNNNLSFDLPDGWFAQDSMYGVPTIFKDAENVDDIDTESNISITPAMFVVGYNIDTDEKVDKKYVEKYFKNAKANKWYKDYTITEMGEGNIGSEKADIYDITVTYTNDDMPEGSPDEKERKIIFVSRNKNCYVVSINVPVGDDNTANEYMAGYKLFADSIKLPTEDQTREFLRNFTMDPSEDYSEDEHADLGDDSFVAEVDLPQDGEDVNLPKE